MSECSAKPRHRRLLGAGQLNASHQMGAAMPTMCFPGGMVVHHEANDPVVALYHELFIDQCYTVPSFYDPSTSRVVVDCGANIGMFALHVATLSPQARIFGFEPCTATMSRLQRNISSNGLQDRTTTFRLAISSDDMTREMNIGPSSGGSSLYDRPDWIPLATEAIQCISLRQALSMCGTSPIDLLKLDVEEAETDILHGGSDVDWRRVRRVALEYHDFIRPSSGSTSISLLAAYGFASIDHIPLIPGIGIIRAHRSVTLPFLTDTVHE